MSDPQRDPTDRDTDEPVPDLLREPDEEIPPDEMRADQARFQGHLADKDDFQDAVDAHLEGEEPDEERPNSAMP